MQGKKFNRLKFQKTAWGNKSWSNGTPFAGFGSPIPSLNGYQNPDIDSRIGVLNRQPSNRQLFGILVQLLLQIIQDFLRVFRRERAHS